MTVKAVRDSQGSDLEKQRELSSAELVKKVREREIDGCLMKWKMCTEEVETDQESGGSSEETESPKSVAKVGRWRKNSSIGCVVHSQVLRIREEDSHIGKDIRESFSAKDNKIAAPPHVTSHVDVLIFSRPILPCSPLSGKTTIKTLH